MPLPPSERSGRVAPAPLCCRSHRNHLQSLALASSARAQQHATRAAFFISGFAALIWAVLVPFAKARTGVNDGALGLILLCLGAGSFVAMPLAGALSARFGPRAVMIATVALTCISLPFLALVADQWLLGAMVLVLGASVGAMDCVINMQAVVVERDAERAMMCGVACVLQHRRLCRCRCDDATVVGADRSADFGNCGCGCDADGRRVVRSPLAYRARLAGCPAQGSVLFIGVLADAHQVSAATAGVGYVAFALTMTMTVTRLLSDAVVERLGRIRLIVVDAQQTLISFRLTEASNRVTLYKVLGGGADAQSTVTSTQAQAPVAQR